MIIIVINFVSKERSEIIVVESECRSVSKKLFARWIISRVVVDLTDFIFLSIYIIIIIVILVVVRYCRSEEGCW